MPTLPSPSQIIRCQDIASCFQAIYNFLFAIFVAIAFLYFFYGAFEYLLSGAGIYKKDSGKSKMINSIIALIVVLVIPIILNMINPGIYKAKLQIPKVTVQMPQLTISAPETPPGDALKPGEKVYDADPNPDLANRLKNAKYITKIVVNCSSQQAKIYAKMQNEKEQEIAIIPIRTGQTIDGTTRKQLPNGQKCNTENKKDSHTTPIGTFTLGNKEYNKNGIFSKETGASLGTRIITYYYHRGLLIHGSGTKEKDQNFRNTYGCIRMKNADLAAIFDKVIEGKTILIIKQDTW
jgi:lipoprotein-anchoring transpeptidase ErfK/SrfK